MQKTNLNTLLEMVIVAEMEELSKPNKKARGTIIEAH